MPLHGRDDELREIGAALDAGRSVGIRGEAGIGKTELWRAARRALEASGRRVTRVVATATTRLIPGGALAGLVARSDRSLTSGDRLVATLRALAATGAGFVLAIDDAHLLDDESAAAVLQHVLAGGVALLTLRRGEPASDAVTRFWKDGLAAIVELGPLSTTASGAFIEELVAAPVDAHTQTRLYDASGGSPLILRELVSHGRATGAFADVGGVWAWTRELAPSPGVAAVIRERLAGIDPASRALAELLAVGGPLPRTLLEQLASAAALAAARRSGMLRERLHGETEIVDLAHPLYGPVLTEALPVERTQALLEQLVAAGEPLAAGDPALAVSLAAWLVRLADRSHPDLLVAAAERAFERADLGLADRLARAAIAAGAGDLAAQLAARIGAFSGERAQPSTSRPEGDLAVFHAALARADGFLVGMGSREAALAALAEARERIVGSRRDEAAAHALAMQLYGGDPVGAVVRDAEALLASGPPPEVVARIGLALGPALTVAGRPFDAIAALDRALAAADRIEFSPYLRVRLAGARAQSQLYAGLVGEAIGTAAERHAEAEAAGDVTALATWSQVLGQASLWQGRPREAARRFGESLALMKGFDVVGYGIWCQAELAFCLAWTDRRASSSPVPVPPLGSHAAFLAPQILLSLAGRDLCLGVRADAEAHATAAAERAAAGGQVLPELLAQSLLVRLRPTRARTSRVAELAASCQGELAGAVAESVRALARGRGAELESAARRLARAELVPLAAEWFLRAADAYRGEGAPLACRRSGNAAQQQRGAMEADPPLPATSAQPDALTSREREVAALAAEGLTNQQIAVRLQVSVRTVHAHLRTVYEKLGVNERHLLGPLLARSSEPPS